MFKDELQELIYIATKKVYPEAKIDKSEISVEDSKRAEFDFSSNIGFVLAKKTARSAEEITEKLFDFIFNHWPKGFDQIGCDPSASGYLNFTYREKFFISEVTKILREKEKYGFSKNLKNKKIQVEFISANPTGPLTLANGRGGFGGDVLANVLLKAGAKVEREYLVNDAGNQVRILGESILVAAGLLKKDEDIYKGGYIDLWVKDHQNECRKLKEQPEKLGELAANEILDTLIKPSVKKMNIRFDNWFSEKKLTERGEVQQALEFFKKKGLLYEQDGALWFETTKFGDDKDRVLVKADGGYTYFATDAAYHWDKFYKRKFDRVINLWGADHHGYVERMMAAIEAMGFGGKLNVVIMQLVRLIQNGDELKMSKRRGAYVTIDELFEMIGDNTKEASDVARFFFLSRAFNTHMDFDLDLAREHSEKNPVFYVKYAYARIAGILRNAPVTNIKKADLSLLETESEKELIKELSRLEGLIVEVSTNPAYPVHLLTFFAQNIATKFHAFYDKCRVIDENNPELTAARLELVKATQIVLGIVMRDLLGIDTPERM